MNVEKTSIGPLSREASAAQGVMDTQLADIVRRLQPDWPGVDVAAVVASTYQRLAQGARVTIYLPVLTEHLTRTSLDEQRRRDRASRTGRYSTSP